MHKPCLCKPAVIPAIGAKKPVVHASGLQAIAQSVVRSVCLRLRNVGCTKDGLQKLLKCHEWIVELDVGRNPIGVVDLTGLFSVVKSSKQWEVLNISRLAVIAGFEYTANLVTPEMVECLRKAPGLKDVDCSENRLDDDRAKIIVEAVKDSETDRLQRLAMNESGCGILTAEALKAVLSQRAMLSGRVPYGSSRCTALRILELRGNKLHDDCMKIFSQGLGDSVSLEKLILAGNDIGDVGVTHLAEGLKKQRALNSQFEGKQLSCVVELDLSCNPVRDQGAQALANAAMSCLGSESVRFEALWGVEEVFLWDTGITARGRDALQGAVASRATLAMEAALALRKSDELIEKVRVKRRRRPKALQVHGLELKDPIAEQLRSDADTELQDLWPTPLMEPESEEPDSQEQAVAVPLTSEQVVNIADGDSEGERTPYAGLPDPMDAWFTDDLPDKRQLEGSTVHFVRMDEDDSELVSYSIDATDDWFNDGGQSPVRVNEADTSRHAGKGGVIIKNLLAQEQASSGPTSVELSPDLSPEASPIASESSLESSRRSSLTSEEEASRQASAKLPLEASRDLCRALEANFNNASTVSNVSMASNASNATEKAADEDDGSPASVMTRQSSMGSGKGDKGKVMAPGKGKGGIKGPKGLKGKGKTLPAGKLGAESTAQADAAKAEAEQEKEKEKPEEAEKTEKEKTEQSESAVSQGKGPGKGPPAKGAAGKGPGKGPPGKGKAPPPPAKGDGKGKGKAAPKSKAAATPPRFVGHTPLGRRLHWAGAQYEEPTKQSVFHGLTSDVRFDPELLKAMLSTEAAEKPVLVGRRKSITKKAGITLLDGSRAQNLAIVMSKMKVSTEEFCQNLKDLHFSESFINPEDVELLIHVLPTPEESKKLLEYKDRVADLRDVEMNIMPFCTLPKGVARMKVAKFALSHIAQFSAIEKRCEALMSAAEQVRSSQKFKEMLDLVVRVGNFINHGVDEVVEGTIRGVSVDSLLTLASFKTGAVSSLHFLCLSLGANDPDFFQALKQSLSSVHEASKEKASALKSSIEAFGKDADTAEKQLNALLVPNEEQEAVPPSHEADLRELMALWMAEKVKLQEIGDEAFDACLETQKYFCVSEKALANLPPLETFFLHIATFLDQFSEAWQEIEKNPKKWEDFANAAGFRQRVKRKSLPAGSSQKLSDGPRASDAGLQRRPRRSECGTASTRPEGKARMKAQARRSVSFLTSSSGFDIEAPASNRKVCRALLGGIYCAVSGKPDALTVPWLLTRRVCAQLTVHPTTSAVDPLEIRAEGDVCRGEQQDGGLTSSGAPPFCQALGVRGHCLGSPCRVQDVVSCLDRYARYEPLDLPGEGRTQEANVSSWLIDRSSLPLQVRGSHVLSVDGRRQVLACVNWYGAHMEMLVNNGLNVRSLAEVAHHIVELKFNCVRLPYSLDSLNLSAVSIPHPASQLCHNPELQASTPLEIFDSTVQALTDAGLLVVLNNHVSKRGWCCDASDGEGLWYTEDFPESVWLDHLSFLAARYRDNAGVVGFDIRNEIRSTEFETPTWGGGSTDWAEAASKGSRRVLDANPDMLLFISGLEQLVSREICRHGNLTCI
ncbi:unnamed protein product [Symbiodinium sp. KB8]|nr:unnamed protein product [Symbiodinium sp. KB8]